MFDVDTTMDTTIEEDDDPPDSTDHSHRVGRRGMLLIDMRGAEILLNEEARMVEPTGNESTKDPSDITNPQTELEG